MNPIEDLYENASPKLTQRSSSMSDTEIYYITYGYDRPTLNPLFPLLVIYDKLQNLTRTEEAVQKFLEQNSDEIYIKAPGRFNGGAVEIKDTSCQILFVRITPNRDPDLLDEACDPEARSILLRFYNALREQGNLFADGDLSDSAGLAKFWMDILWNPEIKLPFPLETPTKDNNSKRLDTYIPCYVITEQVDQRTRRRPVSMKWLYPDG